MKVGIGVAGGRLLACLPRRKLRASVADGRRHFKPLHHCPRRRLDGAGGAVRFDRQLTPHRVALQLEGREPLGVVSTEDGGYWVADVEGAVHRTDDEGRITQTTASPFGFASLIGDPLGSWRAHDHSPCSFIPCPSPASMKSVPVSMM